MRIGFIGAGKVGTAFGHHLKKKGFLIEGYYSRTIESAEYAAGVTDSRVLELNELVGACDYIFITTQDDNILDVWNEIKPSNLQDKKIFHMSGSLSSEIFEGIEECGASGYSLHPLFPFSGDASNVELSSVVFTVEGRDIKIISEFLKKAEIRFYSLKSHDKMRYHAAAVFASNYTVTLAFMAKELFKECGLPESVIMEALYPLLEGAVRNIKQKGIEEALTGPIIRGDLGTVKGQVKAAGIYGDIYRGLGLVTASIAEKAGKTDREKLMDIIKILEEK